MACIKYTGIKSHATIVSLLSEIEDGKCGSEVSLLLSDFDGPGCQWLTIRQSHYISLDFICDRPGPPFPGRSIPVT